MNSLPHESPQVKPLPQAVPGRKYAVLATDTIASLEAEMQECRAQLTILGVSIRNLTDLIRQKRDQQEGVLIHLDVLGEAIKELREEQVRPSHDR